VDIFNAIADPNRRRILELLAEHGQLSATDISNEFQITAAAISQHLKALKEAGLVFMEKNAQQRIYRINPDPLQKLEDWAQKMAKVWGERFDALDKLLQKEKKTSRF
jgi:DNA-binding transcriptional ArsR family regulator